MSTNGYNERLFSGGLRGRLHLSRFDWLAKSLTRLGCRSQSVIELGCFDAKSIEFMPDKPVRYLGLDANWEGGLDIAKEKWKSEMGYEFKFCTSPDDIRTDEHFDIAICMETFEHIPPALVEPYLAKLSTLTCRYLFITVPNEKGFFFALKYLVKRLCGLAVERYSFAEFINAAIGRLPLVQRNEHKGFDYARLILSVGKYFRIVEITPLPYSWLPRWMMFGIGLIARPY